MHLFQLKTKRSGGIPVTAAVHKAIASGNAARNELRWSAAAEAYLAAVRVQPDLYHIWIQLGHSLKESGKIMEAEGAYKAAVNLKPELSEPLLHLGHLYKVMGQHVKAGRAYFDAVKAEPGNADAAAELYRAIGRTDDASKEKIISMLKSANDQAEHDEGASAAASLNALKESLRALANELVGASSDDIDLLNSTVEMLSRLHGDEDKEQVNTTPLVFDASDLIGYYSHARLPTGIQRVQIEAITSAARDRSKNVRICCFIDGRDDWLEVPMGMFIRIAELSVQNGQRDDPDWVATLNKLHLTLALSEPFEFPDGAWLINLGTSWWLHNYFLYIRHAKAKHGIKYIPFVHDFIPIITPEHCVRGLTIDFISWAIGVFDHADYFLVNSNATKKDLLRVGNILGHVVDEAEVAVIPLDADFRKNDGKHLARSYLQRWQLDVEPYILFVSTIESRKGHVTAMDAWLELIRRYGAQRVPRLVCVGKNGWLNDQVFSRLTQSDELASRVTVLSYLSDDELSLLYKNCAFTIYPSLYEGWGLPITESLCYGKPVVAADSSSLPEAGGEFAVYFETGSPTQLANAVEKMTFDPDYRKSWETKIRENFRSRSWRDVAHQIDDEVSRFAEKPESRTRIGKAPKATLGAYHPITRNLETRIWPGLGSGEVFRTGLGWLWPDDWGCWTTPQGGGLAIGLPAERGVLKVYLHLVGLPNHGCNWRLQIRGLAPLSGSLKAGERRWVSFDYPVIEDGDILTMRLRSDWSEKVVMNTGGNDKDYVASIGLAGFFICEAEDGMSRAAFLEAAALGNVLDMDAYREHRDAPVISPLGGQGVDDWDDELI